jgi:hypothetical protein
MTYKYKKSFTLIKGTLCSPVGHAPVTLYMFSTLPWQMPNVIVLEVPSLPTYTLSKVAPFAKSKIRGELSEAFPPNLNQNENDKPTSMFEKL